MVPYSIDSEVRKKVIIIITLISLVLTILLDNLWTNIYFELPDWMHKAIIIDNQLGEKSIEIIGSLIIPSFIVFIIIYSLYCKFLWTATFMYKVHRIPNLNGIWKGKSISNGKNAREVEVTIKQDWNKIFIETTLKDTNSTCNCTVVAIVVNDAETKIKYAYTNPELEGDNKYVGYNELRIRENKVRGGYFTNKPSKGIFDITRG